MAQASAADTAPSAHPIKPPRAIAASGHLLLLRAHRLLAQFRPENGR
jgi:hypothetical protein